MTEQLLAQRLESPSGTGRVDPRNTDLYVANADPDSRIDINISILTGSYAWAP